MANVGTLIAEILEVSIANDNAIGAFTDSYGDTLSLYHQRIWQGKDNTKAIVYSILDELPDYSKGNLDVITIDVTFSIYAEDDMNASYIATELNQALEGWKGTWDGKQWMHTMFVRQIDTYNDFFQMPAIVADYQFAYSNL